MAVPPVLAALGVPCFACTPDAFPDLLAAAIERRDLGRWAGEHGFVELACVPTLSSRNGVTESIPGSFGKPSTRSPTMFRITSSDPPAMRIPGTPRKNAPHA